MDIYLGSKLFLEKVSTAKIQIDSSQRTITAIINGMVTQFHLLPDGLYSISEIEGKPYLSVLASLN